MLHEDWSPLSDFSFHLEAESVILCLDSAFSNDMIRYRGSLKNLTRSLNMETRLKKWRSFISAVISNLKRGFDIFRCEWKTRAHFDAKVYWSVIAYNIRVMAYLLIGRMQTAR